MGLFDFFRKKKTDSNDTGIDKKQSIAAKSKGKSIAFIGKLQQLYSEKNYDEIILAAANYYQDEPLPLEAKKVLVLTYYYKKDYEKSLELAQEIAEVLDDVESWFNVLSVLMALNQTKQGEEVFNKILKIQKGDKSTGKGAKFIPQLCVPFIRYYYAQMLIDNSLFANALSQLEILLDIYCDLKITDATFLYIRGIPFFENYLELVKKVYEGLNSDILQSDIVKKLLSSVDSDGQIYIRKNILGER